MAQLYSKDNQFSANTFVGHKMFTDNIETTKAKGTTYFEVLNIFRKVFKNITNSDLIV